MINLVNTPSQKDGFMWLTNLKESLDRKPVAMNFWWSKLGRQVTLRGTARLAPSQVSDKYFSKLSKGQQISCLTCQQSEPIESRQELDKRFAEKWKENQGVSEVPRPQNWGCYCMLPDSIEFYEADDNFMSDRIVYALTKDCLWLPLRIQP